MAKLITALVLVDIAAHGLKAGQLLEATPETINPLAKMGEVDTHKDAVSYARSQGVPVVQSVIELAAAALAAQQDALRIRIAELEQLQAAATDDATKAALSQELNAKRSELDALQA